MFYVHYNSKSKEEISFEITELRTGLISVPIYSDLLQHHNYEDIQSMLLELYPPKTLCFKLKQHMKDVLKITINEIKGEN